MNNVLQLDACQESDSRPFAWRICFHHDPCPWQQFGSWPIKLRLTLNYPLRGKRGILSQDKGSEDWRSAGGGLDLLCDEGFDQFWSRLQKESNKRAPLPTCCMFGSQRALCQTKGVGFSISVFRQTELSKDPTWLNIVDAYKRMDTCIAFRDV